MPIKLGSREVYGILRWYIMDDHQRAAYHRLTGKATVQQGDIACLKALGVEVNVTDEAYRPEHIEEAK